VAMRRFLTSLFRLAIRIFFKRIEVVGLENIPEREPVIFAVNHPNGLVDPLFVLCFAPRDVSFLAKAPLFRMPVIGYLVRALNAIPVYRKQDQTPGSNEETFARATEILQRGGGIAIFPEGTTHSDPSMRELKTGAARIAIGASLPSIKVIPTGIYYKAKHVFRSEALVWFGKPIPVESEDLSEESVRALTARIDKALETLTLQADSRSALELVGRAETIFSAGRDLPLAEELELRRRFVDGYHYLQQRDPARLARLEGIVRQIQTESLIAPHLDARTIIRVVILFPLALIGALIHWPAYRLVGILASHFSRGESELIATVKFVSALLIYPLTWIAVAVLFFFGVGPLAAFAAIVVLPLLGYIALLVFEDIDEAIGRTRALLHRSREKLAEQRNSIRAEILAIGDEIERGHVQAVIPSRGTAQTPVKRG